MLGCYTPLACMGFAGHLKVPPVRVRREAAAVVYTLPRGVGFADVVEV